MIIYDNFYVIVIISIQEKWNIKNQQTVNLNYPVSRKRKLFSIFPKHLLVSDTNDKAIMKQQQKLYQNQIN